MSFLRWSPWRLQKQIADLVECLDAASALIATQRALLDSEVQYKRDVDRAHVELHLAEQHLDHETTKLAEHGIAEIEEFLDGKPPTTEPASEGAARHVCDDAVSLLLAALDQRVAAFPPGPEGLAHLVAFVALAAFADHDAEEVRGRIKRVRWTSD